jgi:hypothetical protein
MPDLPAPERPRVAFIALCLASQNAKVAEYTRIRAVLASTDRVQERVTVVP